MSTVTIRDNGVAAAPPAAEPAAAATPDNITFDSKGRRLLLRDLTIMEEMDLHVAMGDDACSNRLVLMRCMIAARIGQIDDEPLMAPASPAEFRKMMTLVGREGIDAVFAHDIKAAQVAKDLAVAKK